MRLKASVLLVRYLAGDLTLVGELYGMRSLQEYLKQHCPEHPLAMFREAVSSETSHGARKRLLENQLEIADLESKLAIDAWQRPSKLSSVQGKLTGATARWRNSASSMAVRRVGAKQDTLAAFRQVESSSGHLSKEQPLYVEQTVVDARGAP